tara:strand:+ start:60 stop:482 length:423 start_codon:yes stop_codon:yes gene_type:complete
MIFFRMLVIFWMVTFATLAIADNHETKKVVEDISDDDEVPLNDPFAGNEAGNSSSNLPEGEEDNEMSLYNFKLTGLISGIDHSYISLTNSGGDVFTLTLGQYLGKIKFVDLRLTEAIFEKDDESYIIIDFNNQIREANEY